MKKDNHAGGLEGFNILVTGGGSGIGLGVAKRLVSDGATVTICGRTEERLLAAVSEIERGHGTTGAIRHVVADVSDEERVVAAVDVAVSATGRLDGVVACAGGVGPLAPVSAIDVDAWSAEIAQNLTGTMLTLKHAAPELARAGGGSFVGVSSLVGSNPTPYAAAHSVAKIGVEHLCRIAANELGEQKIRVNCIRPGMIRTANTSMLPSAVVDDFHRNTPISRYGEVEEVAALVRFLVGPESAWFTGQVVNLDGGQCLRRGMDVSSVVQAMAEPAQV